MFHAALIRVESGDSAKAHSSADARSCGQTVPSVISWGRLSLEEAWDARKNVDLSARLLVHLAGQFDDVHRVLGAYVAGKGRIRKNGPSLTSHKLTSMGKYSTAVMAEATYLAAALETAGSLVLPPSWHTAMSKAQRGEAPLTVTIMGASHTAGRTLTRVMGRQLRRAVGPHGSLRLRVYAKPGLQIRALSRPQRSWQRRLDRLLDGTALVVLVFGTNASASGLAIRKYELDVKAALQAVRSRVGADLGVLLVGGSDYVRPRRQARIDAVLEAAAAADDATVFFSLRSLIERSGGRKVWEAQRRLQADRIHFRPKGYVRLAEAIVESFAGHRQAPHLADGERP